MTEREEDLNEIHAEGERIGSYVHQILSRITDKYRGDQDAIDAFWDGVWNQL